MKITGTVKEMINAGIISSDSFLASFEDSLVEVMPSPEELKDFVKNFNSENKSKEMKNISYAIDLNDEVIQMENILCVEAQLIPAAFFSKEPIDESKIDLDKILSSIYEDEEDIKNLDKLLNKLLEETDVLPFFLIAKI